MAMENQVEAAHLDIPWSNIIQTILAISFGSWAWLLRKFGESHITTIKELASEIKEMRRELNRLTERVQAVEVTQKWLHKDDVRG